MIYVSEDDDRRFWSDCESRIFLDRGHFLPNYLQPQRRANRRYAALSRSVQRPKGVRLSAMLAISEGSRNGMQKMP